ncbi:MAG: methylcobamide--CoM methyltransferase [Proteobacteria bacterium]|nr:methylcobamide--CoM methyltransferase [Pseudomonadota bacterium]
MKTTDPKEKRSGNPARLDGTTPLIKLKSYPEATAVVDRHFPGLFDNPTTKQAFNYSLNQIVAFTGFPGLDDIVRAIVKDLEQIEAGSGGSSVEHPDISLPKEEVVKAVEKKNPSRIPIIMGKWWGEGLVDEYGDRLLEFERFPHDVSHIWIDPTPFHAMNLSWELPKGGTYDNKPIVDDWAKLDEFIEKLPDPLTDTRLDWLKELADAAHDSGQYLIFGWWTLFFEKPWAIRGMENIMMDYYNEPEKVARLHQALADHYCKYIHRAGEMFRPDGFWTSDDLGHQRGPMMSPATFKEFMVPYYKQVSVALKQYGMHFWLHSCGDNTPLMDDLIESGVDVFHPVQKHCMDEAAIAEKYGDRMTFLTGIDVQHTLQEKDPAGVREEVRFLIDTFDRPDGGMCLAAGNGIVSGTPFENIEAFLDEALTYGEAHRRQYRI